MKVVMGGIVTSKYFRVNAREVELLILKEHDDTRTNGYKPTMKKVGNLKGNKVMKTSSSPKH